MSITEQSALPNGQACWTADLNDITLEAVLRNQTRSPYSFREFAAYLEETYCAENLTFYLAVNDYMDTVALFFGSAPQHLDGKVRLESGEPFDFSHDTTARLSEQEQRCSQKLQQKFRHILDRFIRTNATQEINIPYELRAQLLDIEPTSFHPAALKPAQAAVVELLRISAFLPFTTHPDRNALRPLRAKPTSLSKRIKNNALLTADDHSIPTSDNGFLKRLTSSLRFRARSPSPPRMPSWRQISVCNSPVKEKEEREAFVTDTSGLDNERHIRSDSAVSGFH